MIDHDVIIVGGGLAGSRAALEIARTNSSLSVAVVAKTHPIRSHSVAAQGGIAATLKMWMPATVGKPMPLIR